jgi:hypothetical protein
LLGGGCDPNLAYRNGDPPGRDPHTSRSAGGSCIASPILIVSSRRGCSAQQQTRFADGPGRIAAGELLPSATCKYFPPDANRCKCSASGHLRRPVVA